MDNLQNFYLAFEFANQKHKDQKITGSELPYISHIANVCFQLFSIPSKENFDFEFLMTTAALHDTLEDTQTTDDEIINLFGKKVFESVKSLSKNYDLPKDEQMEDSIARILRQPIEVSLVKLADRIVNLNPPPKHWGKEKITKYYYQSVFIYEQLHKSNQFLANIFIIKLKDYKNYF